jgi:hypothetical protein
VDCGHMRLVDTRGFTTSQNANGQVGRSGHDPSAFAKTST